MATDNQMAGQMEYQQQEHPSPASSQDRSKSGSHPQSQSLSGVPNAGIASFRRYVILIYLVCRVALYSSVLRPAIRDFTSLDM